MARFWKERARRIWNLRSKIRCKQRSWCLWFLKNPAPRRFCVSPKGDWRQLVALAKLIAPSFQSQMSGRFLKVTVSDEVEYRDLSRWLENSGVEFKSFMLKQDRPVEVVVRGLPSNTEPEDIKTEIEAEGFKVIKISQMKNYWTKAPMPLFYVQIENGVDVPKIYDFTELFGTRIEVKPFDHGNKINQCCRCQGWFHSSEVCHLPPRCWEKHIEALLPVENTLWRKSSLLRKPFRSIPPLQGALGSTAITPIEKAEVIADSLQEQFEPNHVAGREDFDQRIHAEVENFLATPHVQEIEPTTPTEVLTYVQRIKPKKSPGLDQISNLHQLLRVTELIHSGFEKHDATGILFLDIAKAFDKIWHDGLLIKLIRLDFPAPLIKSIHSFLSNRSFRVRVDRILSS
ncbi:zinc finger protein [Trichonephila clavipes]|nr:zinc finger protein [Trichonephila clavipes]